MISLWSLVKYIGICGGDNIDKIHELIKTIYEHIGDPVDYAELVGSPVPSSYGIYYTYEEPEDILLNQAAEMLQDLVAELEQVKQERDAARRWIRRRKMRLIDADALIERTKYSFYDNEKVRIDTVTGTFLAECCSPTIDAVEVVRCKDCDYWGQGICNLFSEESDCRYSGHYVYTDPEAFCSYGEKAGVGYETN